MRLKGYLLRTVQWCKVTHSGQVQRHLTYPNSAKSGCRRWLTQLHTKVCVARVPVRLCSRTCTNARTHAHTHTHTRAGTHTRTRTHMRTRTHTHAHTHTHTHAHTHTHTHAHTHARTRTHAHARTHARTHTHTHTLTIQRVGKGAGRKMNLIRNRRSLGVHPVQ